MHGVVHSVGTRRAKGLPAFELLVPVFAARRLGAHKVLVVDRLPARPHALRPAKVGYAAGSRDAGTGEDQDSFRAAEVVGEGHAKATSRALTQRSRRKAGKNAEKTKNEKECGQLDDLCSQRRGHACRSPFLFWFSLRSLFLTLRP